MDSTFWEAVSAVAAVVAVIGGAVSWWKANASRVARDGAEAERERAERQAQAAETQAQAAREQADLAARKVTHLEGLLEESRSQSASLEKLADASDESPFRVEFVRGQMYRLLNRTDRDARIEWVVNRRNFAVLSDLDDGTEVPAHDGVNFRMMGANGSPLPATLIMDLGGEDVRVYVDLPVKPHS